MTVQQVQDVIVILLDVSNITGYLNKYPRFFQVRIFSRITCAHCFEDANFPMSRDMPGLLVLFLSDLRSL